MLLTLLVVLCSTPAEREVARIQEHLRGASALLGQRDVSALTAEQRRLRALNAKRLLAYTVAARFPKNHVVPGRVPVFRDEEGTLCAVGALLWASGEHELVEHIVATRNTATVWQLADEPGLAQWLDAQGLTLAEAARIQPSYEFEAFHITTPSYRVALGACSPPVQLEPDFASGANYQATARASSTTAEFFSDPLCATALSPPWPKVSSAVHFRDTTPGRLTLTFSNQGTIVTQEHDILLADGGTIDAGPFDAGTVDAGAVDAGTLDPIDAGPAEPVAEGPVRQRGCGCASTDASLLFGALALLTAARRRGA